MKGDFSRVTFNPTKQYMRVLMQQGRVQLDADWNEQVDIFWHHWQNLIQDLIGPHGGPARALGFKIERDDQNLTIGTGRYYVGGLLCENFAPLNMEINVEDPLLVYLHVWERHITYIEDGNIREVALGGPDTTTRSQVVWQVNALELTSDHQNELLSKLGITDGGIEKLCGKLKTDWQKVNDYWWPEPSVRLRAQTGKRAKSIDPCIISPESRYRGAENQLYRVEIHTGGVAGDATYKWSRDNGSRIFPIHMGSGNNVSLTTMGRDSDYNLNDGNLVEVVDDTYDLRLEQDARPVLKVAHVERVDMQVTLASLNGNGALPNLPTYVKNDYRNPLLRRWDGYGTVEEGTWLALEDGVQIQFALTEEDGNARNYKRGDYWLIPARVATGDVEWPGPKGNPEFSPPHGIKHYYAPLAIIRAGDGGIQVDDCRNQFPPILEMVRTPE
jgi:hypothetical protein